MYLFSFLLLSERILESESTIENSKKLQLPVKKSSLSHFGRDSMERKVNIYLILDCLDDQ